MGAREFQTQDVRGAALLNGLTPLLLLLRRDISATLLDCLARCRAPFG